MGDENPPCTLGDYSRPSHEVYRNTIELPEGNNVVPLRSDTIRLVQNECEFHELRFKDPNQHLKDFLKLVDSFDLNVENRESTHFEEAIYKQREEINQIMTEMFSLLKEFTKGKSLEKVLVREEVKKPVTKYDNVIFLVKIRNDKDKGGDELVEKSISKPIELRENEEAIDDVMDNQSDRSVNKDSTR
ncbi:hypothetical protein Tco_0226755 [Tanacetum coccineum]